MWVQRPLKVLDLLSIGIDQCPNVCIGCIILIDIDYNIIVTMCVLCNIMHLSIVFCVSISNWNKKLKMYPYCHSKK